MEENEFLENEIPRNKYHKNLLYCESDEEEASSYVTEESELQPDFFSDSDEKDL